MKISSYTGAVQAGFPSPAMDYMEERLDLNKIFIEHPLSTFIIECRGDSMINAFIPPKARLIVDRSLTPKNGDIILAELNGEFTVKFLKKNDFKCWLIPANSKYRDIEVSGEMTLNVWGVVTAVLTETKDLRQCML
jgi:DNA polymerase V